jgi:dihydrodipicolinate synthase/N-acetylneuraminate lyase
MKTTPVTPADLSASVIAVPPLARRADLSLDPAANRALIRHLEEGGVRTLMYGGNANFYHLPTSEFAATLELVAGTVRDDTWVIPSAGADYGKLMDQAAILRDLAFPTAMALPFGKPSNDSGVATALRRFADRLGKPIVAYVKGMGYIEPATLGALAKDGVICAIKYAIVHWRDYGLRAFTSGSVCVAPRGSMRLLALLKAGHYDEAAKIRAAYIPLEDRRDALGPIRVLHDAVTLAGIAEMGPILPMISNLEASERAAVQPIAKALLAHDRALATSPVAA